MDFNSVQTNRSWNLVKSAVKKVMLRIFYAATTTKWRISDVFSKIDLNLMSYIQCVNAYAIPGLYAFHNNNVWVLFACLGSENI